MIIIGSKLGKKNKQTGTYVSVIGNQIPNNNRQDSCSWCHSTRLSWAAQEASKSWITTFSEARPAHPRIILDGCWTHNAHTHAHTQSTSQQRFAPQASWSAFLFSSPPMCPLCSVCRTHTAHRLLPSTTHARIYQARAHTGYMPADRGLAPLLSPP